MSLLNKSELRAVWAVMKPDIFTTRLFFDPLAVPLTILFSRVQRISANHITFAALLPGLIGAWCFVSGRFEWGAVGYYLFFLLDSVDGKLARLRGNGDPLGGFYDFAVDRIVIGAMALGMSWSFANQGLMAEFIATLLFLLIFFLKDVLDLKWKESRAFQTLESRPSDAAAGVLARYKIHFKPGQLLSCFIFFLAGPITGLYVLCAFLSIGCVLLSMVHNVLIPLYLFLRASRQ